MLTRQPLKVFRLLLLAAFLLLAATACVPEIGGIFVNMDKPGTTADGVDYDVNDILFNDVTDPISPWFVVFDGELYGLNDKKHDLSAFAFNEALFSQQQLDGVTETELYLSFEATRARVPGIPGYVQGQDIVKLESVVSDASITPTVIGYAYEMYFDGSDVGLTTQTEKVDGITVWPAEYLEAVALEELVELPYDCNAGLIFLSTRGSYRVPNNLGGFLVGDGSDVLAFCAVNSGPDTAGFWFRVFDGSEAGIKPRNALTGLDVFELSPISGTEDSGNSDYTVRFFFTPRKAFTAHGGSVSGNPSEVFVGTGDNPAFTVGGPEANLNDGSRVPAVNGVVENMSTLEVSPIP